MQELKTEDLKKMREEGRDFLLVNVLGEDSFRKAHIPGSKNVPHDRPDFPVEIEKLAGGRKDRPVVVYCASTACDASPKAARKLDEVGFSRVYDYEAGVRGWKEAGLELQGTEAHA